MVTVYRVYLGRNFQFLSDIPRLRNNLRDRVPIAPNFILLVLFRSMFIIEFSISDSYMSTILHVNCKNNSYFLDS